MSSVVSVREIEEGIVEVTMQDTVHKNGFSPELTAGLIDAFAQIDRNDGCRVIVLTGYDNYFASGGTQEALLALQSGVGAFTDTDLYSLPMQARVPVIAAMQGHAIGGGFVFGLFADFVILGSERIYTANFMKYGFTPGMGATYIVPHKLGPALGHEMLIAARSYRGAELATRGIPFRVVPAAEVLHCAHELARDVAEKPRGALIMLKDHLIADLRAQLPSVAAREVAMHAQSFLQADVKERIRTRFGN